MSEDKALRRARAKLVKALEENRELEAIELLAELRRYEPDNARWPHKQGELLKQLGHTAQAAQVFEKAVALYAKQGFIARAVAMAKTVVELDPTRIGILEKIDPHAAQLLRTQKKVARHAQVDLDDRPVEQLPLGTAPRDTGPMDQLGTAPRGTGPIDQLPRGTAPRGTGPFVRPGEPQPPTAATRGAGPMARHGEAQPPTAATRGAGPVDQWPQGTASRGTGPMVWPGEPQPPTAATRGAGPMARYGEPQPPAAAMRGAGPVEHLPTRGTGPVMRPGPPAPPVPRPAAAQRAHELTGLSLPPRAAPQPVLSQRPARAPEGGLNYQKLPPPGAARSLAPGRPAHGAPPPPPPEAARSLAPGRPVQGAPPPPPPEAARMLVPDRQAHAAPPEAARMLVPDRQGRVAPPEVARSLAPGRPAHGAPPPPEVARMLLPERPARGAPPQPPSAALQVQAAAPAVTLDRLSIPPFARAPRVIEQVGLDHQYGRAARAVPMGAPDDAAPADETRFASRPEPASLDQLYSRAARAVPMLTPDEAAPADETRFSSRPEAANERAVAERLLASSERRPVLSRRADTETDVANALAALDADLDADEALDGALALSEVELAERVPLPVLESQRPEPPTAATLADLPLFPLFAALPQPVLARIVAASELIELSDGAYVLRKDDDGDALYGIVAGSVNLTVPGQAFELTLAEGDVFGETCLLEEAKSQLDVLVMGQLTALRIPRGVLLQGIEEHAPLAGLVLALLTRRLLGNLLQVSPLFQDFDAAGKAELARLFEVRRVAGGTQLSVAGKKMDGLYISLSGTLIVEQHGAPTWAAQPGSMFGQNCLLRHTPSGVDVSAAVDMIVLRLPAARFAGLAMQHPTVLARLTDLSTSDVVRVML